MKLPAVFPSIQFLIKAGLIVLIVIFINNNVDMVQNLTRRRGSTPPIAPGA